MDSSDDVLSKTAADGLPIPHIELRKRVWYMARGGKSDIAVTYVHGDLTRHVSADEHDPELSRPPTYLERKFLHFRRILPGTRNVCAH